MSNETKRLNPVLVIPLLLVNGIAVTGQFLYWKQALPAIPAVGFALALESISVYVAYHAHLAEISQDTAFRLRLGSYAAGAVMGLLNGSHFIRDGQITAVSVGMFILSAASPWLWAIHSRRESRDDLKSKGLIEDRAVKLGAMRWILWPKQAFPVFRRAVWNGESNPVRAIAEWEESRPQEPAAVPAAEPATDAVTLAAARTKADAIRAALAELGESLAASAVAGWLGDRGWTVTPGHVRAIRAQAARKPVAAVFALPSPAPDDREAAGQE